MFNNALFTFRYLTDFKAYLQVIINCLRQIFLISGLLLGDDTMGIQYLLANYGIPISAEIERAEAWTVCFLKKNF